MGNKASTLGVKEESIADDVISAYNAFGEEYIRHLLLIACRQHAEKLLSVEMGGAPDNSTSRTIDPAQLATVLEASFAVPLYGSGCIDRFSALFSSVDAAQSVDDASEGSASTARPALCLRPWPYALFCPPAPQEPLAASWVSKLGETHHAWRKRWAVVQGARDGYACVYYERQVAGQGVAGGAGGAGGPSNASQQALGAGAAGGSGADVKPRGIIPLAGNHVRDLRPLDVPAIAATIANMAASAAAGNQGGGAAGVSAGAASSSFQAAWSALVGIAVEATDPLSLRSRRRWLLRFDEGGSALMLESNAGLGGGRAGGKGGAGTGRQGTDGQDDSAAEPAAQGRRQVFRDALRFASLHVRPLLTGCASDGGSGGGMVGSSSMAATAAEVHTAAFTRAMSSTRWRLGMHGHWSVQEGPESEQLASLGVQNCFLNACAGVYKQLAHAYALDQEAAGDSTAGIVTNVLLSRFSGESGPAPSPAVPLDKALSAASSSIHGLALALGGKAWEVLRARAEVLTEKVPQLLTYHELRASNLRGRLTARLLSAREAELTHLARRAGSLVLPVLQHVLCPAMLQAASALYKVLATRLRTCLARGLRPAELRALYQECQLSTSLEGPLGPALHAIRAVTRPPVTVGRMGVEEAAAALALGHSYDVGGGKSVSVPEMLELLAPVSLWEVEVGCEQALRAVATACIFTLVQELELKSKQQREDEEGQSSEPLSVLSSVLHQCAGDFLRCVRVLLARVGVAASAHRIRQGLSEARAAEASDTVGEKGSDDKEAGVRASCASPLTHFTLLSRGDASSSSTASTTAANSSSQAVDPLSAPAPEAYETHSVPIKVHRVVSDKSGRASACASMLGPALQPAHVVMTGEEGQEEGLDGVLKALFWDDEAEEAKAALGLLAQHLEEEMSGFLPPSLPSSAGEDDEAEEGAEGEGAVVRIA